MKKPVGFPYNLQKTISPYRRDKNLRVATLDYISYTHEHDDNESKTKSLTAHAQL